MLPVARLEDLNLLKGVPADKLVMLIKSSLASLESGVDLLDEGASAQVKRVVQVLAFLFAEAAKLRCTEADFRDSLVSFEVSGCCQTA